MPRRILILGGARFLGLKLAEHFCLKNDEVSVLNRGRFRSAYDERIRHLKSDRNDVESLREILKEYYFDVIIDNNAYFSSQVDSILECMGDKCGHYIFTSTAAIYINQFYTPPVESYAANKMAAEDALKEKAEGLNYTIMRPANIFGEGDFAGKLVYFYNRLIDRGGILLEKEIDRFSIIYAEDLVNAYDVVAGNPVFFKKILNIADSDTYNYHDFFSAIFGSLYADDCLTLAPGREIWNLGYRLPFAWGLPIALSEDLSGKIKHHHPSVWGKAALEWEREKLMKKMDSSDYRRMRKVELDAIRKIKDGIRYAG